MKKTQVALAALALAASAAASATEVKLSGQIDIGAFHSGKDVNGNGGTYMEQGGLLDHSSITLSVTEDLGNGLKAIAVLESGFAGTGYIDNGGNAGLWNRQSFVGLSSDSLGTVGLGKQLSPFILSQALSNFGVGGFWVNRLNVGGDGVGAGGNAGPVALGGTGTNAAGFFIPNAITYTSPSLSGVTVRAMTTTSNGTQGNNLTANDPDTSSNRYDAVSVDGNIAGAFVTAAYQRRSGQYNSWTIGAIYPIMPNLSIMANYMHNNNKVDDVTVNSWAIGGKYTITAGTDLILQYAQNNGDNDTALKKRLTNLTLTHSLSKRTTVYGSLAQGKQVGSALGRLWDDFTDKTNTSYGVGIAHNF